MSSPKLTIITITYNNSDLPQTLDSVTKQIINSKKIEHIIVDNVSTDGTKNIVEKYQKNAPYNVVYICEKDTGRFNAMNKGLKKAKGDYLLFLNAGDYLHDHQTLSKVIPNLNKYDLIYGDIVMKYNPKRQEIWSLAHYHINKSFFIQRTLFHQACFIKKSLFDRLGPYDEHYQIVADFEFFLHSITHQATTQYVPLIISNYDANGISSRQSDQFITERCQAILKYFSGKVYLYHLIKYFYYRLKKYLPHWLINYQQQRLRSQSKYGY